jgi:hypothetical protein
MPDLIKCARCNFRGQQTDFPRKANLQYLTTCGPCTRKRNDNAAEKRRVKSNQENVPEPKRRALGRDKTGDGLPTISWKAFQSLLEENRDHGFEVHAIVTLGDDATIGTEDHAHALALNLAMAVGNATQYRFKYVSMQFVAIFVFHCPCASYKMKRGQKKPGAVTYTFYCAQFIRKIEQFFFDFIKAL